MFSNKPEVKEVKTEAQLVAQLNEAVKVFVNGFLDAGLSLQSGSLYDSALPKTLVNGVIAEVGKEMFIREGKAMNAGQCEVPTRWNPYKNTETRKVDTRTPQEKAAALRKRQIEDNTAEFMPG